MSVRLSYTIQTHPARHDLAEALAATIGASISTDPEPDAKLRSAWRTYRHALEQTPAGISTRVILQDDVTPCPGFVEASAAAISARPDRLISFIVCGVPHAHAMSVHQASDRNEHWAVLNYDRWCPTIALAWPTRMIRPFLDYVDSQDWPVEFCADDEIVGRFLRHTQETALATVPCLVEHEDRVSSLVGRRAAAGADRGRVSTCFINETCDATLIDWTLGPQ